MERALISLGPDELRSLIEEQETADLSCRFCDQTQHFDKEELLEMLESMQK